MTVPTSELGNEVGIVHNISRDAVFSTIENKSSFNKGVRAEISGVGIYNVFLCPSDYNVPDNINPINYWDNSTITKTEENRQAIIAKCIEVSRSP